SSKGHFVKASGLRWLCAMLLVPVPWADRIMAPPFLTVLAPSKRFYRPNCGHRRPSLIGRGKSCCKSTAGCRTATIVLVADSAFAAIEFLAAVGKHVCVVTRLRLDANLFAFPPPTHNRRGRPALKGKRFPKLAA